MQCLQISPKYPDLMNQEERDHWDGNLLANHWQPPEARCNLDLTEEWEDLGFT